MKKHHDLIIQWAAGATAQSRSPNNSVWVDEKYPMWHDEHEYRIKKEKTVTTLHVCKEDGGNVTISKHGDSVPPNLQLFWEADILVKAAVM